jgi:putative transposase
MTRSPEAIRIVRPVIHTDEGGPGNSSVTVLRPAPGRRTDAIVSNHAEDVQRNVLDRQRWQTREELRLAIVTWIERTYQRRRPQRAIGKLTPIEFEAVHEVAHAA